tara:strand:- start:133 stop:417 length:285 start_codon:yes stop_codon:yes gene_type:complete
MRLAIIIDLDGDIMYAPEDSRVFENYPKPKLFDNLKDAEEECAKWNTGVIVDYDDNDRVVPRIRAFDDEERRRAMVREEMNRDDGTSTGKDSTQ